MSRTPSRADRIAKKLLWAALIIFLIASAGCAVNLYQESQLPGAEQAALVSRKPSPVDRLIALLYMLSLLVAIAAFIAKVIIEGKVEQLTRVSDQRPEKGKI